MSNKKRKADRRADDRCAVARDLMVLCVDGLASEASQRRVNRHVKDCLPCKQVWEDMQTPAVPEPPAPVEDPQFDQAVRKVRSKQKWRSLRKVLLGVVITAFMVFGAVAAWWYWGEQVVVMPWEYSYALQARFMSNGQMYIKAFGVPENTRLEVRMEPELNRLYAWVTTNRATKWKAERSKPEYFIVEDFNYLVGSVLKTEENEAGDIECMITMPNGQTMWVEQMRCGMDDSMYATFLRGEMDAAAPNRKTVRMAHVVVGTIRKRAAVMTPMPTYEVPMAASPTPMPADWDEETAPETEVPAEQLLPVTPTPEGEEDELTAVSPTPAAMVVATMPPRATAPQHTPTPEPVDAAVSVSETPSATPMPNGSTATEVD